MGTTLVWKPGLDDPQWERVERWVSDAGQGFVVLRDQAHTELGLPGMEPASARNLVDELDLPEPAIDAATAFEVEVEDEAPRLRIRVRRSREERTYERRSAGDPSGRADAGPDEEERPSYAEPLLALALQAPAIWASFELPAHWWGHLLRVGAVLWLLVTLPVCFRHARGAADGLGLAILANAALLTVAWRAWPTAWAWGALALLGVSVADQLRMIRAVRRGA
ncbi:MAG: hypothetical protein AAFZ65_04005 [Planctomycetota bacterium]